MQSIKRRKNMKLVFASNNKHKLEEVQQILPSDVEVISLNEIGFFSEIDETGATLEANSAIKARVVWNWLVAHQLSNCIDGVFADDTGLEINALEGAPGVRTARWAGDAACDLSNRQKALNELDGITDRRARFRTVVSLIINGRIQQVEGIVEGEIALREEGDGGFGYDPVFIPKGFDRTFACLPSQEKNAISHRGKAMEALKLLLEKGD